MKRLIAIALLLAMMLTLFAGCNSSAPQETEAPATEAVDTAALEAAAEYLKTIYKEVEESTPIDFQRVAAVRVGLESFDITWSTNVAEDLVKIVEGNGMVTIDVNEENPEDVPYVLTATISDAAGNTKELSWNHFLPAAIIGDFSEILDMAYALEDGESMPNSCTLTGIISTIDTAWSDDYQNITVTIVMEGCEDKPIMCYRLKGEGAKDLAVGDQITVTGTIKNYKGTIEFDAGCTLDEVVKGVGETAEAPEDVAQIMDEAYALAQGKALPYTPTLTGEIISVDTAWSDKYQNITVTIVVEGDGRTVQCYRLKGDGAKELWKGDIITVTGTLKNYYGKIEFDAGCQLLDVIPGDRYYGKFPPQPEDPTQVVDEAYALVDGGNLPYNVRISGYVTAIVSPWSDTYHNITVNIVIPGRVDKPIQCYRMHGSENGANTIEVGDYITVFGSIKNYKGTIEFFPGALCEKVVKGDGTLPWVPDLTPEEIVDAAYALEEGKSMANAYTLTGKVTKINTAYSEQYKNVTVTIVVEGREDKPIECYRMKGTDAANVEVGDTITVTGVLKNYYGKIEFDAGCTLDKLVKAPKAPSLEEALEEAKSLANGEYLDYVTTVEGVVTSFKEPYSSYGNASFYVDVNGTTVYCYRLTDSDVATLGVGDKVRVSGCLTAYTNNPQFDKTATLEILEKAAPTMTPEEIVDAAYALEAGQTLEGTHTLTGVISSVDTPYDSGYKNVTVTIKVPGKEDKPIQCFRLKGTGADVIRVGDTITVTGTLKNYNGTIEFDAGCTLDAFVLAAPYDTPGRIVLAAYALGNGKSLDGTYTLTGVITKVNTAYNPSHSNVTVTIAVPGYESKPIMCFRLKGTGADVIKAGDTITVTGVLKNYNGTIEFDAGCTLDSYVAAAPAPEVDASSSLEEILAACSQLNAGEYLTFQTTITEEITWAGTYSSQYGNITVNMDVGAYNVQAYRLKGTGVEQIAVGDTITVTGYLGKNTKGNIAFKEACTLDSWTDNTP